MKTLLVANRGEIAVRVLRTARRLGLRTVAVYSDADAHAPHVQLADVALPLGPAPSSESYLRIDKILAAARASGADAIHPGYGFLSENAAFARAVAEAGLTFVGPDARAIALMGSKLGAKRAVAAYGVPLVPGTDQPLTSAAAATETAQRIGFPLLIKASAGGGGKGMRRVERMEDFAEQMALAQSEARSAFGDDAVFLERYVTQPRHIEIQVLADHHGGAVYLHERECSIQRRHQKVVEEAPSALLTPALRQQMGEAALAVVRAAGYTNAGTVEFLVDASGEFYFLEMNTRLQVEHPVTECITGLDLVEQQLRIADGQPLGFTQADVKLMGHALELRVYAEDPRNGFLPAVGTLHRYQEPVGPGIRVDSGYRQGMPVPIYYDPMLAKLIVHAPTRAEAIRAMQQAIDQYEIVGCETTLPFGRFVMQHPAFQQGQFDTGFVAEHFRPELLDEPLSEAEALAAVAAAAQAWHATPAHEPQRLPPKPLNAWRLARLG